MGDTSVYLVRLDTGSGLRVTQPNTHRTDESIARWEEPVWVSWHRSSPVVVTE